MKQTKITMNLKGLDDLVSEMGHEYVARVGILGSKNTRKDGEAVGNADLGMIHTFGSISQNIPPRDFLKSPLEMKKKRLLKVLDSGAAKKAMSAGDYKRVYEILGLQAQIIVQGAFASGGYGQWPALKPQTISRKGSSAPLIDTGELRRAQTHDVVKRSEL